MKWKGLVSDIGMTILHVAERHLLDLASAVVGSALSRAIPRKLGIPMAASAEERLVSSRMFNRTDIDGRLVEGPALRAWAKWHILKPFPKRTGIRRLAGEDEPHRVDDFSGEIKEGYGKGMKKLIYTGNVVIKKGTKLLITKANIHEHKAERAGKHWDLVIAGVKPGTKDLHFNIPSGPLKGRYAFVETKAGVLLLVRRADNGVLLPKPKMALKNLEWLKAQDKSQFITEWKADGGMASCSIDGNQLWYTSWRPNVPGYAEKLPGLEFLVNRSPYLLDRLMFSTPKLGGTVMYVELFWPEGASRLGGLLNAGADKAIQYQAEHGPVRAFIWDIVRYKGKSVKGLPYAERRALIEKVAEEIKPFCPLISAIPKCPEGVDPVDWYKEIVSDRRGLPWSEGIVLKPKGRSDLSYKVKDRDTVDCKVLEYVEGEGKYEGTLGKIVVQPMDKRKGHGIGEVGSLQLTDEQRDWVWANKDLLINEVAEISAQGRGPTGAILKGVFKRFHPGKSEAALLMYAEGSGSEDPRSAVFAMKTARGWKGGR